MYVPSSELVLPQPLSCKRVCPPPDQRVGGHIRLWLRGWGSPNYDDWRKSLAPCLLCAVNPPLASDPPSPSPVPTLVGSWNFLGVIDQLFLARGTTRGPTRAAFALINSSKTLAPPMWELYCATLEGQEAILEQNFK